MLAVMPLKVQSAQKEMTLPMSGKLFVINFSPAMDENAGLISAFMAQHNHKKTGRTHVVAFAVDALSRRVKSLDSAILKSLVQAYVDDTQISPPGTRQQRGIWLAHESGDQLSDIGVYLETLNSKELPEAERVYIPRLRAKSDYNKAQLIFFALRLLADEIRVSYPNLPSADLDMFEGEQVKGGRKKVAPDEILAKYSQVVALLRSGMNINDIIKQPEVTISLNTVRKIKRLLDEE